MRPRFRNSWLSLLSLFCLVLGSGLLVEETAEVARADTAQSEPVVDVSRYRAQLFLHDDHVVAQQSGLEVVMGRIEKHPKPVLVPDKPWELGTVGYTCVLQDREEGLYKMWYESRENMGKPQRRREGPLPVRGVEDGLEWQKPALGVIRNQGSDQNNIVFMVPPGAEKTKVYWVIKDYADPDPAKLYKMMFHLWGLRRARRRHRALTRRPSLDRNTSRQASRRFRFTKPVFLGRPHWEIRGLPADVQVREAQHRTVGEP